MDDLSMYMTPGSQYMSENTVSDVVVCIDIDTSHV